jgi:hypothetical protein
MNKSLAGSLAALALTALAAGCGNYGTTAPAATPIPTPAIACTAPPQTVALAYPPPGAAPTASPNYSGIILAVAPTPLPTDWFAYVQITLASPTPLPSATPFTAFDNTPLSTTVPSPLPSLLRDPKLPNETYEFSSLGAFANSASFKVFVRSINCFPGIQVGAFSS